MTILSPRQQALAFRAVVFALVGAAALTFSSLWAPLVLAAWVAAMTRPLLAKMAKVTRGRDRAAGAIVLALVVVMLVPLGTAVLSVVHGVTDLARSLLASDSAKNALVAVVSSGAPAPDGGAPLDALKSPQQMLTMLREHGAQAAHIASGVAGAASGVVLGVFVFLYAVYVFLVDGPSYYDWLEKHAPLDVQHTRRLVAAFSETGRGLFVSVGLTGLVQGLIATITYLALGVPRALVLGLLTCVASLIPFGTGFIWVPIAVGLALAGKIPSAIIMALVGVLLIGTVDNVLRPVFARFGKLDLSTFVLLTSLLGGMALFGAWGLLLGPLFARLAKEALVMARIDRLDEAREPSTS